MYTSDHADLAKIFHFDTFFILLQEMPKMERTCLIGEMNVPQPKLQLDELIPTRQSLLSRLKDCDDQEAWRVFFDTYWKLIYNAAIRAKLSEAEAQDVVQETVIAIARKIPEFVYDPSKGSFKTWLMRQTAWRIAGQIRKRLPVAPPDAYPDLHRHHGVRAVPGSRSASPGRVVG